MRNDERSVEFGHPRVKLTSSDLEINLVGRANVIRREHLVRGYFTPGISASADDAMEAPWPFFDRRKKSNARLLASIQRSGRRHLQLVGLRPRTSRRILAPGLIAEQSFLFSVTELNDGSFVAYNLCTGHHMLECMSRRHCSRVGRMFGCRRTCGNSSVRPRSSRSRFLNDWRLHPPTRYSSTRAICPKP